MVINLTPHPITICNAEGQIVKTIQSEGVVRLKAETVPVGQIDEISVSRTVYGEPEGLPDYQKGVFYIVSQLTKNALPDRKDLLVPAEIIRDEKANIIGCKSLGL